MSAANKLLGDYRKGLLGYNSLEILHPTGLRTVSASAPTVAAGTAKVAAGPVGAGAR